MKEANKIEEVFKNKLYDLESPVREDLWDSIAAKAGIQKNFWSGSKIAGLGLAVLLVSAAVWLIWPSLEQKDNAPQQLTELTDNEVQNLDSKPVENLPEHVVASQREEEPVSNKSTKPMTNSITIPTSQPEPGSMTIEEWTAYLRDRKTSIDLKSSTQDAEESKDVTLKNVDSQTNKVKLDILQKEQGFKESFEPAERLDLMMLIAPEKIEEASREAKHYPSPFPRIFNPNLSGDAAYFSIDVRDVSFFKIEIRNQKGQLVFTSQDPDFIWKGTTLDGALAPEGTYLFIIESNDLNGEALKPQSGAVFLMRK